MEKIIYTMTLDSFLADERFGEGTMETIINNKKIELLQKLYFDKLKGKEDNFIIQFKNEYWDYNRINYVIDNVLEVTNGLYRNPLGGFIDRAEAYKLISDKKPFDIILMLKTKEELDYEKRFDEALNEEKYPNHQLAKDINNMVDRYNKEKEYDIRYCLYTKFSKYEREIESLNKENKKLKNLLINLSNEKDKYKEIAELFKESNIWDLQTNYDDCEYCLCDSSDGHRTYSLTAEQYYKLEKYLIDRDKKEK